MKKKTNRRKPRIQTDPRINVSKAYIEFLKEDRNKTTEIVSKEVFEKLLESGVIDEKGNRLFKEQKK